MAFQSPPARRRYARQGQPRNTSAPIIANMPSRKRTSGADPVRGLNSRKIKAATSEPSTKPMISGRMYWTAAARCSPSAPAMSRLKQATQMPMLPGLPSLTRMGASTPTAMPVMMGPHLDAKKRPREDMVGSSVAGRLDWAQRAIQPAGNGGTWENQGAAREDTSQVGEEASAFRLVSRCTTCISPTTIHVRRCSTTMALPPFRMRRADGIGTMQFVQYSTQNGRGANRSSRFRPSVRTRQQDRLYDELLDKPTLRSMMVLRPPRKDRNHEPGN